jgi:hypothetical protein
MSKKDKEKKKSTFLKDYKKWFLILFIDLKKEQ